MQLKPRVFIAHATDAKDFARTLTARLKIAGFTPFFDERDLEVGAAYDPALEDAAKSCSLFIFVVSARAVAERAYSLTELEWAVAAGRNLMGVYAYGHDDVAPPPEIAASTCIRSRGDRVARAISEVRRALKRPAVRASNIVSKVAALLIVLIIGVFIFVYYQTSKRQTTLSAEDDRKQTAQISSEQGPSVKRWPDSVSETTEKPAQLDFNKVSDSSDPNVATSLANLSSLYEAQGKYKQAEETWTRVLAIQERAFGRQHPSYAATLESLASLLVQTGRYQDAEKLQSEALNIIKAAYGTEHPKTASALNGLAVIFLRLAEYEKAAPLIEDAIAIRSRSLGPEHKDMIPLLENLLTIYTRAGDNKKVQAIVSEIARLKDKYQ